MRLVHALVGLMTVAACGDDKTAASVDAPRPIDAPADVAHDGPDLTTQTIELAGAANGAFWDDAQHALFFTDEDAAKLMVYTDVAGVQPVMTLPTAPSYIPGGITALGGKLVTPNFGPGATTNAANEVFVVDPSVMTGVASTGLLETRHRIGVGVLGTTLYAATFTGTSGAPVGAVESLTIGGDGAATEALLVFAADPGFKMLVGLVATGTSLFVSDQTQKKVFKIDVGDPNSTVSDVGAVADADLMSMMPNGDLIVGGKMGVRRLTQAGVDTQLFSTETFDDIAGSSYDPTGKRLFFINHSSTAGTPDKLEVRPLPN